MKRSRPPRIVVIGSSNTDLVLACKRLPRSGETVLGGKFARYAGGKGANQAVAAARAGARVAFVGRHGDDEFGRAARASLRLEGIDVRNFQVSPGVSSGIALILAGNRSAENMIAVAGGANALLGAEEVRVAEQTIMRADAVLCQLEVSMEAVKEAARLSAKHGVAFFLNPAPAGKLPVGLLRHVHILTPNETEAQLLTGTSDPARAAAILRRRGCRQVVVTMGAQGAWVNSGELEQRIRAPRVKPVDTVGAGDCFSAWLAVGVASGLPLVASVRRAVQAASLAATRPGAQSGMPYLREVSARTDS